LPLTIDIRFQNAALTLADELNFTRAAERLSITQPALSKQISDLEEQLGFKVFERTQRQVNLTDAGQVFIGGCRDAHIILERAIRAAKAAKNDTVPVVTIGLCPYADPQLVESILSVHLPLYPNLRLRIESMFAPDLIHGISVSELDLAIITEPSENPLFTSVKMTTHALCVSMPCDHPASAKSSVTVSDFGGVGWMVFARKAHPAVYDRLMIEAQQSNVTPVEIHHYVNPQGAVRLIDENFGVAFVAKGIEAQMQSQGLTTRPLSHPSLQLSSCLVLRSDQSSRLVNEFGRMLLKKVHSHSKSEADFGQLLLRL